MYPINEIAKVLIDKNLRDDLKKEIDHSSPSQNKKIYRIFNSISNSLTSIYGSFFSKQAAKKEITQASLAQPQEPHQPLLKEEESSPLQAQKQVQVQKKNSSVAPKQEVVTLQQPTLTAAPLAEPQAKSQAAAPRLVVPLQELIKSKEWSAIGGRPSADEVLAAVEEYASAAGDAFAHKQLWQGESLATVQMVRDPSSRKIYLTSVAGRQTLNGKKHPQKALHEIKQEENLLKNMVEVCRQTALLAPKREGTANVLFARELNKTMQKHLQAFNDACKNTYPTLNKTMGIGKKAMQKIVELAGIHRKQKNV